MADAMNRIMGQRTQCLQYGIAAGVLALTLTMTIAVATIDADSLPVAGVQDAHQADGVIVKRPIPKLRLDKTLHWLEIGQASWYGPHLQGKKTANGEWFDMNGLTCAHRTLPLGSWVRVTNLKNRRSVFVRVNDRGPVPENRVVDLSYGAARAVGLAGIGKVKLEPLRSGDADMERELVAQLRIPLLKMAGQ